MTEKRVDVVIVGAGVSGLAAAYRLKQRSPNLTYAVLEANGRIGGRSLTMSYEGPQGQDDAFDLGGHWVSTRQKDIMELIEDLGEIEVYPQNITGTKVMQVGKGDPVRTYKSEIPSIGSITGLVEMQLFIDMAEDLVKKVDIADPYACPLAHQLDGQTVEEIIKENTSCPEVLEIFNAAMQASLGCDVANISALFFLAYANAGGGMMNLFLVENQGAQEFRVKGGTQQIAFKLTDRIGKENVFLDHAVTKIDQTSGNNEVKILTGNGSTFLAKRVIITAPPNIVANRIDFSPPLPRPKQRLYEHFVMGNLVKAFCMFRTAFWLEDGWSGEVVGNGGPSRDPDCENGPTTIIIDATTKVGTPALVAFIAGKHADQWMTKTVAEQRAALLNQMESYFGPKVRREFVDFFIKDWKTEPYLRGGPVNHLPPGHMHNFHALRTAHNRVHFAGTHTSIEWCGYFSGAVQAGNRAVAEVLSALDPTSLQEDDRQLIRRAHPTKKITVANRPHKLVPRWPRRNGFILGLAFGILIMYRRQNLLSLLQPLKNLWNKIHL